MIHRITAAALVLVVYLGWTGQASAQYGGGAPAQGGFATAGGNQASYQPMNRFFYYPYYYFPHSYWPSQGPKWPEPVGAPYRPAPAYMAYPPFKEPNFRYSYWEPKPYYRGFHFWLDQF